MDGPEDVLRRKNGTDLAATSCARCGGKDCERKGPGTIVGRFVSRTSSILLCLYGTFSQCVFQLRVLATSVTASLSKYCDAI